MHRTSRLLHLAPLVVSSASLAACLAPAPPRRGDAPAPPHRGDAAATPHRGDAAAEFGVPSTLSATAVSPSDLPVAEGCADAARRPQRAGVVPVALRRGQRTVCGATDVTAGFALIEVPSTMQVSVRVRPEAGRAPAVSLQRGCGEGAACLPYAFDGQRTTWVNASPSAAQVLVAVALPTAGAGPAAVDLDVELAEVGPVASCTTARVIDVVSSFGEAWSAAGEPTACAPDGPREPALHYAVDVPPGGRIDVGATLASGAPTFVSVRSSCDPGSCLASASGVGARASYRNASDAPQRVILGVTRARGDTSRFVSVTVDGDAVARDAGPPPPVDAAIQPPLPRDDRLPERCGFRDGAPPEHARDEVSSAYRRAGRPPVWSLGPDDVLWLSHPALEGRTLADVASGSADDLLITRDAEGRVTPLASAEGVVAASNGLVATASGALMVARVATSASVSGRPLALPAGLALLRFDRRGQLTWAEALPSVTSARLDLASDWTARLLATTAAPGALRGLAFGAMGRRLTQLRFDARDAPARAVDLGAEPVPLDEVIYDTDDKLRVRSGDVVLAFDADGAPRWRVALPPGTHRLRRDGTAWSASLDCAALGAPPSPPDATTPTDLCLAVLHADGRTRSFRRLLRGAVYESPRAVEGDPITFAESSNGAFVVVHRGTFCVTVSAVPPSMECISNAYTSWVFSASDPEPLVGADVSPRCFDHSRADLESRWVGAIRCRRSCAASGTCAASADVTTDASCGAAGRSCAAVLAPLHQRGRCAAGECAATGCVPGWGDCNGAADDGCEVDLRRAADHCGACGNACAGRCEAGRCCGDGGCAAGVFESDGSEGAFAPSADVTLPAGVHQFTRIDIPAGVTVRAGVGGVLDLRATEAVRIDGTVELSGGDSYEATGGDTGRRTAGGASGSTGSGPGGGAGAWGLARGEAPGDSTTAIDIPSMCSGALRPFYCDGLPRGGRSGAWAYDGGGASAYEGVRVLAGVRCHGAGFRPLYGCYYANPGAGSIGPRALRDLPVLSRFEPGSGGGYTLCSFHTSVCGGPAGGGGGGGALRIASRVSIALGPAATVRADGGATPFDYTEFSFPRSRGHGSGGVISLAAPAIEVASGAYVSATSQAGGLGRVKLSVDPARCRVDGTFVPPLPRGCVASTHDALCETYVAPWPG